MKIIRALPKDGGRLAAAARLAPVGRRPAAHAFTMVPPPASSLFCAAAQNGEIRRVLYTGRKRFEEILKRFVKQGWSFNCPAIKTLGK